MMINNNEIKISQEYAHLVPELTKEEFEELKQSIKENNGLFVPIIVNQHGILLDGHHRYKACQELKNIEPRVMVRKFESPLHEKKFVIEVNLKRRHLNNFQRVKLALKAKPVLEEIAKQNESLGGKGVKFVTPLGRVDKKIGDMAGVSHVTVGKVKQILEKGTEEQIQRLEQNKTTINKVSKHIQKEEQRQDLIENAKKPILELPESVKLLHGDFIEKSKEIQDNSTPLIFTDPPYERESLPLYKALAIVASRVLKPGGSLVTYAGNIYLPQLFQMLLDKEYSKLTYWAKLYVKHTGGVAKIWKQNLWIHGKDLLWFVKGDQIDSVFPLDGGVDDFIESKPVDKAFHEWEQSTIEAEYVISKLTVENQVVLDPMLGAGTTGVATLKLNRKFIGIEIDENTYRIATGRIAKFLSEQQQEVAA